MAKILVIGGTGFIGLQIGEDLGWAPILTLEDGMQKTVACLKEKEQVV